LVGTLKDIILGASVAVKENRLKLLRDQLEGYVLIAELRETNFYK